MQRKTIHDAKPWREGLADRCESAIASQAGLPLEEGPIERDFQGRGNRTRKYCNSVTNFAMQAFRLNEQVDTANDALTRLCRHYLDHPHDLHEAHSFHWSGATFGRIWSFYGPEGSVAERLTPEARDLLLEVMWAWASVVSPVLNPDQTHIWRVPNTENHHAMGMVTAWAFSGFLAGNDRYASRAFTDGRAPAAHHAAWSEYLKAYFRARVGKGQCVEIACNVYNGPTLHGWYNVHDLADDADLRRMAGAFLDLYWASWAEDQIDGVRGGGKTRIYPNKALTAERGGAAKIAALYFGAREPGRLGIGEWVVATSSYKPPEWVYRLAFDVEGRGEYEVVQRCMGLQEPGWNRTPDPPVLPFGIASLREDFGGILRYSWCTPDFVAGTLMLDAQPIEAWSGSAIQNRWIGVIFRGQTDARIVPSCTVPDPAANPRGDTYHAHRSVQKKGAMIVQMLPPGLSRETKDSRVWISAAGLSEPVEEDGWIFVESAGTYAAIRVVDGGYAWDEAEADEPAGRWLRCLNPLSAIVIDICRKLAFVDGSTFRERIQSRRLHVADGNVTYESADGNKLTMFADYARLPSVDGHEIDLAPGRVYDSPFIRSGWDSGVVRVGYGEEEGGLHLEGFSQIN